MCVEKSTCCRKTVTPPYFFPQIYCVCQVLAFLKPKQYKLTSLASLFSLTVVRFCDNASSGWRWKAINGDIVRGKKKIYAFAYQITFNVT